MPLAFSAVGIARPRQEISSVLPIKAWSSLRRRSDWLGLARATPAHELSRPVKKSARRLVPSRFFLQQ